ncbi:MAG: bifunctional precorrin-2 dehydrogenase/sirohydrochlorin ferrochelatase [Nitriliruptorales bacterium]|nr:bifunctional precorrin-2 dehydrogenase/sirohydrochlorin ferrochelatase [Nitriliruptorales bacterium]
MSFRLPIVLDVNDQRCLVIGGGTIATQRAELLLDAGAHVVIISEEPSTEIDELVRSGRAGLMRRQARPADLDGARVAFVTLEDEVDVDALWAYANEHGVLLSSADDVDHCHFAMPSVIRRGDLQVAISTSGRAPALSKRLRTRLEETIGEEVGRLVDVLAAARAQLVPRTISFGEWSERWSRALEPLDELTARIAAGDDSGVLQRIVTAVRTGEPATEAGDEEPSALANEQAS